MFATARSRRPPAWVSGTLGLGIALSLGVFAIIRKWEGADLLKRTTDQVEEQLEKLRVSMLRSIEVLYSITSFHATEARIEKDDFREFVRGALERQPELQALSWNPVVTEAERPEFESAVGFSIRERNSDGNLAPAGLRKGFVPVCFIEPITGNDGALGYDLSSDEQRRQSLERARDTGKPIGTAPIRLAQGPDEGAGFLVVLPAFTGSATSMEDRQKRLAGYAVAVFRVKDLVGGFFAEMERRGIEVELRDITSNGAVIHSTVRAGRVWGFASTELEFAEHRWAVSFASIAATPARQSWIVLVACLAFTGLATAFLWSGWLRTQQVDVANETLRAEVGERKRAEAAAAAANKAKSDFLAAMSHEIRTPLNGILGYAQMMQRDPELSSDQRESVTGIRSSGLHLLGLINEVLDLSKIEAGRMDLNPVDFEIQGLVRNVVATFRPLCAQKRIGLRVALDESTRRMLRGDEGKLRQIIINLLGNAVKFTVVGEVFLGICALEDGRWQFEVIDTGLGIPDEERDRIFEPFHQGKGARHQGGTGLGLAIARRQVELMGGQLEFESKRGIGTRFFFTLHLPDAAALETPVEKESDASRPAEETVVPGLVQLPGELSNRLMIAAELHSATALKSCLQELRQLGPLPSQLADAIRQLMRSYDMDGIQRLLAQATGGSEGEIHHGIGRE